MAGRKPRPDHAERLQYVLDSMALQRPPGEIANGLVEKFGVAKRTAYGDIERGYASLEEDAQREKPARRHQLRATLRTILRKALVANNLLAALKACQEIARIDGMYAPVEVQHEHQHTVNDLTSADKRKELHALLTKYAELPLDTGGKAKPTQH